MGAWGRENTYFTFTMSIFGPILRRFFQNFSQIVPKIAIFGKISKFSNNLFCIPNPHIPGEIEDVLFNDAVINNFDETEFIGNDEELNEEEEETHENDDEDDDEDVELSDFN